MNAARHVLGVITGAWFMIGSDRKPSGHAGNLRKYSLIIFSRMTVFSTLPFALYGDGPVVSPVKAPHARMTPETSDVPDRGNPVTKIIGGCSFILLVLPI
jgi:hypothetical protein